MINTSKDKKAFQKKEELRMAAIFSGCLLFFYAATVFFIYRNIRIDIYQEQDQIQSQELNAMSSKIYNVFSKMEVYLSHVSNLYTVRQILQKEDPVIRREVEHIFSNLIEVGSNSFSPTFDQIRLLDLNGMERVRLNLRNDRTTKICPVDQLQDKSDRYYFKESLNLSLKQIYMSPMDLNIEHGKIEVPHKPMIRFTISVFDLSGKRIGFLIFNYRAQQIIDYVEKINNHAEDQWILINEDGYYLYNSDPAKNFSFMFPEPKVGFYSEQPDLWKQISNSTKNKFIQPDGIYYRKNISPFLLDTLMTVSKPLTWTLLMFVPKKNVHKLDDLFVRGILLATAVIAPILGLLGWFLGKAKVKNKWYLRSLEESVKLDGMTGLYNHREISEQLDYQITLHKRSKEPLSLVFIDLNDLKKINDTFGHKSGDEIILAASDAIVKSIRKTDIAARIGGDEFLVIFPNMKNRNTREVVRRIELLYAEKGKEIFNRHLTLSWGVSYWRGPDDCAEEFINRADTAMYEMKEKFKTAKKS